MCIVTYLTQEKRIFLEQKANDVRQLVIDILEDAGSGHTAGPLGMADVFTAFYFHILNHNPKEPLSPERDRFILSNGHIVPVRYATMALAGYFSVEEAKTLRKFGTRMQGHPERILLPEMETTSGPLGSGLSQAAGMALSARIDGKNDLRFYCMMGDGEQDAGNVWEAFMFAGKYKLSKLTAIIDRNNIQINGMTEDVMPLEPLRAKYEAFNWHVIDCDAHNMDAIVNAVEEAKAIYEKPTVIIMHAIAGKGIKEIEFDYRWHGIPPSKEQEQKWLTELRSMKGKIASIDTQ